MKDIRSHDTPLSPPAAVIAGGETTVTVTGNGHGGRNQEFVLSAAMTMPQGDVGVVIASMGTDGIDGMSDAAGAIADAFTLKRASKAELNPDTYLRNNDSNTFFVKLNDALITGRTNDSNTFFVKLNDALITGRTGTNVNDVVVMLVE
jgi:glycerate-2-kinase